MNLRLDWLLLLGFAGQSCYGLRILIQWIASERRGESTIPVVFWYLSLCGAALLLLYAVLRGDLVFMVGQSMGGFIYLRNLVLTHRRRAPLKAAGE
jgi:lipid-A-disaccharide synthase-like uncharacterized protein